MSSKSVGYSIITESGFRTSDPWIRTVIRIVTKIELTVPGPCPTPPRHFVKISSQLFTAQCTLVQSAVLRSHVVCPSVRPSVTLVICDHIGWKSWKLITRSISPTSSLFAAKRRYTYSQGNMGEFFWETRDGVGKKWHAGEQKRQYL